MLTTPSATADTVRTIASGLAAEMGAAIAAREVELAAEQHAQLALYRTLGIPEDEGRLIDRYHNKSRFLYRYAGTLVERAVMACIKLSDPAAAPLWLDNPEGHRPKRFSIDCLSLGRAIEIKWRDATTDGDHVGKELAKLHAVVAAGYTPIRLVFFEPTRQAAQRIQRELAEQYAKCGGTYLTGAAAWYFVNSETRVDVRSLLLTA